MSADGIGERDIALLRRTIALARMCPPSETAFSVGAVVADAAGRVIAEGYSRRDDPHDHAEEAALRGIAPDDSRLAGATLYSSLEPCGRRASRPLPCAELILGTPVPRVVYAWHEPVHFVDGDGAERLAAGGRTVVQVPGLAAEARAVNAHLIGGAS